MRLAWISSTAQRFGPYLGLAVVLLFLAGWLTRWDGALAAALAFLVAFALVVFMGGATLRITPWDASRSAERGLGARDVLTTALEFDDPDDEVHQEIQERANRFVTRADSSRAIPIPVDRHRLRQVGLAAVLALVVALLPQLGSTPALSSGLADALEAEAEEVEKIAEAVTESDVEGAEEIVAELERLAEELRQAETLEQALQALNHTDQRLDAGLDPRFLAQKAAVQGLARDLSLRPLVPDAPVDAVSQLEQLADSLAELSEPELRALEERLGDLAASQAAGNPTLSDQLARSAESIRAGDLAAAAQGLREAAASQRSGLSGARGQQAITETQRALAGVQSRLAGAGSEQGQDQAPGEGAQGEGQDPGQGEGQGQGQGQGEGQGSGGQIGQTASPSGQISGVQPGAGGASGQGGPGSVGPGAGDGYETEVQTSTVYDPIDRGVLSDLIRVGIDGGIGEGAVVGRGEAPTQTGQSVVPYAQVLPEYLNQAADALSALQLPPSMRGIVQSYFEHLAAEVR
jgi:hypothetical protein